MLSKNTEILLALGNAFGAFLIKGKFSKLQARMIEDLRDLIQMDVLGKLGGMTEEKYVTLQDLRRQKGANAPLHELLKLAGLQISEPETKKEATAANGDSPTENNSHQQHNREADKSTPPKHQNLWWYGPTQPM